MDDWNAAIDRNRDALLGIVMMLFAAAGIARGGVVDKLPRRMRCMIFRTLRAAESACRRLIVVQTRLMRFKDGPKRAAPTAAIPKGAGSADRVPAFRLFDTRKRFGQRRSRMSGAARITSIGYIDPIFADAKPDPTEDDPLDAKRLCRRLEALARALETLPQQGKRLLRAQARRRHVPPGPRRVGPLRPGWPPGYRRRHTLPVDEILYQCHIFALRALEPPDTS